MLSALPPALRARHAALDLFFTLTGLIQEAGGHVTYGHPGDDSDDLAVWDATTRTLTLHADADADHTWALTEFCRHLTAGESQFVDTARRHLYAVS